MYDPMSSAPIMNADTRSLSFPYTESYPYVSVSPCLPMPPQVQPFSTTSTYHSGELPIGFIPVSTPFYPESMPFNPYSTVPTSCLVPELSPPKPYDPLLLNPAFSTSMCAQSFLSKGMSSSQEFYHSSSNNHNFGHFKSKMAYESFDELLDVPFILVPEKYFSSPKCAYISCWCQDENLIDISYRDTACATPLGQFAFETYSYADTHSNIMSKKAIHGQRDTDTGIFEVKKSAFDLREMQYAIASIEGLYAPLKGVNIPNGRPTLLTRNQSHRSP